MLMSNTSSTPESDERQRELLKSRQLTVGAFVLLVGAIAISAFAMTGAAAADAGGQTVEQVDPPECNGERPQGGEVCIPDNGDDGGSGGSDDSATPPRCNGGSPRGGEVCIPDDGGDYERSEGPGLEEEPVSGGGSGGIEIMCVTETPEECRESVADIAGVPVSKVESAASETLHRAGGGYVITMTGPEANSVMNIMGNVPTGSGGAPGCSAKLNSCIKIS